MGWCGRGERGGGDPTLVLPTFPSLNPGEYKRGGAQEGKRRPREKRAGAPINQGSETTRRLTSRMES